MDATKQDTEETACRTCVLVNWFQDLPGASMLKGKGLPFLCPWGRVKEALAPYFGWHQL